MIVEVTMPVKFFSVREGMAWAASVFEIFTELGWQIRDVWSIDLSEGGVLWFVAERPSPNPQQT